MNGMEAGLRRPFPRRYGLVEQCEGVYVPVEIVSESLQKLAYVSVAEIRRTVLQYVWAVESDQNWSWTVDDAKKCVDMWFDLTLPLENVHSVRFASETGYCFTKHCFDPDSDRSTPVFNEITDRMSNKIAFMTFIGSLFYPHSKQQQYLWLKGSGQDSKGCITRLLKKILGDACRSANPPTKGQNPGFWLDNIMRAKCVIFNDIEDRQFVTTGLGKSLTGGDVQSCERKYGASYDAIFDGKLIFTSNWSPNISSEHSDQRRIIYCELSEKDDKTIDPGYEEKLWYEAAGIIDICKSLYEANCMPDDKPIPVNNNQALEIAESNEEDFELFMDLHYNVEPSLNLEALNSNQYIMQSDLTLAMRSFFKTQQEKNAFKKWVVRKFRNRVKITTIKENRVTKKVVLGLTKKVAVGKPFS